jgi:recombinational DNA repair ATPase RecF
MSNSPLIKKIRIRSFRGAAKSLDLDFSNSVGIPRSLILYGDNGSGKSTVVDALEFVLQQRIAGYRNRDELASAAKSLASNKLPSVKVEFDDGSAATRYLVQEDDKIKPRLKGDVHGFEAFQRTPLVLRRADILRFWETPAEQRQLVFIDYGRPQKAPQELPQARI